jgi:hypothetical protein
MIPIALIPALSFIKNVPREAWYALAILLAFIYFRSHYISVGIDRVEHKLETLRAAIKIQETANIAAKAAKEFQDLAAYELIAKNQKVQNEITKKAADNLIASVRRGELRLRDDLRCKTVLPRTTAPAGIVQPASEGGLSQDDEEFLIRYAERADEIANELNVCKVRAIQDREIIK